MQEAAQEYVIRDSGTLRARVAVVIKVVVAVPWRTSAPATATGVTHVAQGPLRSDLPVLRVLPPLSSLPGGWL